MRLLSLDQPKFSNKDPLAEPLHVSAHDRVLRFALHPGQSVRDHSAPHSPVVIVVLHGKGMFAGGDGIEHVCGPNSALVFEPGEMHAICALEDDLVFLAILHESPYYGAGTGVAKHP